MGVKFSKDAINAGRTEMFLDSRREKVPIAVHTRNERAIQISLEFRDNSLDKL